jgi:hypothetical protein
MIKKRARRALRASLPALAPEPRPFTRLDLFTAFALAGYLAAQGGAPNKRVACKWARTMGAIMAREQKTPPPRRRQNGSRR